MVTINTTLVLNACHWPSEQGKWFEIKFTNTMYGKNYISTPPPPSPFCIQWLACTAKRFVLEQLMLQYRSKMVSLLASFLVHSQMDRVYTNGWWIWAISRMTSTCTRYVTVLSHCQKLLCLTLPLVCSKELQFEVHIYWNNWILIVMSKEQSSCIPLFLLH